MSGCGKGKNQSRQFKGRFQHGNKGQNRGKTAGVSSTNNLKFYPHSSTTQQSITYDVVKDFILDKIQKEYTDSVDIVKSLRDLQLVDIDMQEPVRLQSGETDEEQRKFEQETFDMKYDALIKEHILRKRQFKANLSNAFALIKSFCNKTMVNKLEALPDYESKIRDDPIELLQAIKLLMHDPERARYPYASLTEAMGRMINIKQGEEESLIDYTKRFKQARDIFKSHVGGDILDVFVMHTKE